MRISIKCSTAIHMLLVIASLSPETKVTSNLLASSVGCNPVEIRKLLSKLKKFGIIDVSRGTGGAKLTKNPEDISLLDIYSAVDSASLDELIGVHKSAAKKCPIGKNIYTILADPYEEIGNAIRDKMAAITFDTMLAKLYEIEPTLQGC